MNCSDIFELSTWKNKVQKIKKDSFGIAKNFYNHREIFSYPSKISWNLLFLIIFCTWIENMIPVDKFLGWQPDLGDLLSH